jgi:hypothetical protein
MLKTIFVQSVTYHWRTLLLTSTIVWLSACVAQTSPSSSSVASIPANTSSSITIVSSSAISNPASSSSEAVLISSSSVIEASSSSLVIVSSSSLVIVSSSSLSVESSSSETVESSSSEIVVSSSSEIVVSSSSQVSSQSSSFELSSSSMDQSSSSVNSSQASEQILVECNVPLNGHNLYGSGFDVNGVTVTNTTNESLDIWTATLEFPAPINQLFNSPQGGLTTTVFGTRVVVRGTNLAVGQSIALSFGGSYVAGSDTRELPSCVAEKFIPAPIIPLEPDQTGPLANGYCPLNSGLGVGSTSQHELFVVTQDGGVAKIAGGNAVFLNNPDGSPVSSAIAASAGSYSSDVCYALENGNVQCGKYQSGGTGSGITLFGDKGHVIQSVTTDINANVCFLNDSGEAYCGTTGAAAAKTDFGGTGIYTYLNCGRSNRCCALDSAGDMVCGAAVGRPSNMPEGEVLSFAGTDLGFCAVFDTGRSYCWGEDGGTIGRGQGAPAEEFPVTGWTQVVLPGGTTSVAGGQWHNCWLMADTTVYCSGESNDLAAGGGSELPTQITLANGNAINDIVAINGAKDAACAVDSNGDLFCWAGAGSNGATAVKIDLGERMIRLPLDCR